MKQAFAIRIFCLTIALINSAAVAGVSIGQTDTFQDGTTDGWTAGANPTPPFNNSSGGPAGAGDMFLQLTANGGGGAGGKLVAIGGAQWTGDYLSAGVTGISMAVNNLGGTDLSLRLYFAGPAGSAFSTSPVSVQAGSGWATVLFSTQVGALTVTGVSPLSNVTGLRLYHSVLALTNAPGDASQNIVASLGVDNIAAVPEPGEWLTMLAGMVVVLTASAARRRRAAGR